MFDFSPEFFQRALIYGPVLLFSLTIHEYSHAWTAFRFGDDTAARMGRLTLNPLAHLDLFGTLVMVMSGFRFGWAKPVPVNPLKLRNPRVDDIWVSAAGPLANICLALISALLYRLVGQQAGALTDILQAGVFLNIILAFFNLIPLFPLDGSHILRNLVPQQYGPALDRFNQFAPFILLFLVFTRVLWIVLGPPVWFVVSLLLG